MRGGGKAPCSISTPTNVIRGFLKTGADLAWIERKENSVKTDLSAGVIEGQGAVRKNEWYEFSSQDLKNTLLLIDFLATSQFTSCHH